MQKIYFEKLVLQCGKYSPGIQSVGGEREVFAHSASLRFSQKTFASAFPFVLQASKSGTLVISVGYRIPGRKRALVPE